MRPERIATLTRASGAVALTALLVYGGVALAGSAWAAEVVFAVVAAAAIGTALAVVALGHVDTSVMANAAVLILLGLGPIATFVGWSLTREPAGLLAGMLWFNLVAGIVAGGVAAWNLAAARTGAAPRGRMVRV